MQRRNLVRNAAILPDGNAQSLHRRHRDVGARACTRIGPRTMACLGVLAVAPLWIMLTEWDYVSPDCFEAPSTATSDVPGDAKRTRKGCQMGTGSSATSDGNILAMALRVYIAAAATLAIGTTFWYSVPQLLRLCGSLSRKELRLLFCGCTFALALLVLVSIGSVPPLQYGIRYNRFTKHVYLDDVYRSGRYFVGPWTVFVLFPATVSTIEFIDDSRLPVEGTRHPALHARTQEGLGIDFELCLQYRLVRENIGRLYRTFGKKFEEVFTAALRDGLMQVSSGFMAQQFWTDRRDVQQRMLASADQILQTKFGDRVAECWELQILSIRFPANYEDSIVKTMVAEQIVLARMSEQATISCRAQTLALASQFEMHVRILTSAAQANATMIAQLASATARQRRLYGEAQAMAMLRETLALEHDELVTYALLSDWTQMSDANVVFGF